MKSICYTILVSISINAFSQNTPRFSQFNVSKGLMNPAAVGTEAKISSEIIYRSQWLGVKGAPSTGGFVFGAELLPSMAVGLTAMYDQVGIAKTTTIQAAYAYRLIFNEEQYLSLGASLGVQNVNADYAAVQLTNQSDNAFNRGFNQWLFNASVGMYYNGPKMYAGFAIPELVQNVYRGDDKGFRPNRWHYYLSSGFYLGKESSNYTFNPCVQVKLTPNAPVQADLLLRNIFRGTFAFTVGYRSENALIAGMDFMIANKARIGYSFNYNLGPYSQMTGSSHEIYLGFGLPYYYEGGRFQKRKYMNKKGNYSSTYKKSTLRGQKTRGKY